MMLSDPIKIWYELAKKRDAKMLDELLADDATLYSPILHKPQVGKSSAAKYLSAALNVFLNDSISLCSGIQK